MIYRYKGMLTIDHNLQIKVQFGKSISFSLIDINKIYIEFNTRWRLQLFVISLVLITGNSIIFFNFYPIVFIVSSILSLLFYNYLLYNIYKYKLIIKLKNDTVIVISIPEYLKKKCSE